MLSKGDILKRFITAPEVMDEIKFKDFVNFLFDMDIASTETPETEYGCYSFRLSDSFVVRVSGHKCFDIYSEQDLEMSIMFHRCDSSRDTKFSLGRVMIRVDRRAEEVLVCAYKQSSYMAQYFDVMSKDTCINLDGYELDQEIKKAIALKEYCSVQPVINWYGYEY